MPSLSKPFSVAFRLLAGTAVAVFAFTSPAVAAPEVTVGYVALGDSYAAGVGAGTESTACRITDGAYARQWAGTGQVDLTLAACSGADSADVLGTQLGAIDAETDLISLTVGTNDLKLVDTLRLCAAAPQGEACTTAIAAIPQALATTVPAGVGRLLAGIRTKAPAAKLVVTGYPLPFADVAQCPQLPLPAALRTAGNQAVSGLNQVLAAQAKAADATFVDVAEVFAPHAQCTQQPWLVGAEGLSNETVLHPTLTGQTEGYLAAFTEQAGSVDDIIAWIRDRATTPPSATPSASASASAPADGGSTAGGETGGSGGGLPVTGPGVAAILGVGLMLVAVGTLAYLRWRPRRIRTVAE